MHSICILRLSAIGDVCHAVSTVQAIQHHYPDSRVTWIVGKVEALLLANLSGVELVVFDKSLGLNAYTDLKRKLKGRNFDVLLHMQVALRANLASLVINAKRKVGFNRSNSKEFHSLFTHESIALQDQAHVLESFAGFARHIGVPFLTSSEDVPTWNMPLAKSDIDWAQDLLRPFREQGNNRVLIISPAASKAERNWLPERYAEIADYASAQGFQVIICGGPDRMDALLRDKIVACASSKMLDVVGKTSLKQLLALLQEASLVVAPDTGPAHMAVTVGTPVIGLYGHSNPARTGPYLSLQYTVETYHSALQQQTGKRANQHRFGKRVKGEHIMANISVGAVKTMFDKVVKEENL